MYFLVFGAWHHQTSLHCPFAVSEARKTPNPYNRLKFQLFRIQILSCLSGSIRLFFFGNLTFQIENLFLLNNILSIIYLVIKRLASFKYDWEYNCFGLLSRMGPTERRELPQCQHNLPEVENSRKYKGIMIGKNDFFSPWTGKVEQVL